MIDDKLPNSPGLEVRVLLVVYEDAETFHSVIFMDFR